MNGEFKEYLTPDLIEYSLVNVPQITFEITDACNLNCTYCGYGEFYSDHDDRNDIMLPIEKAKALIDYLSSMWNLPNNVSFNRNIYVSFYGGEPLLNMPFIKEIVDHFNRMDCRSRSFTFSMTTNGLLLHKYIDYLAENKFHTLVSLDGNREANDYRIDKSGRPAYDRIIANIDMIKEKHPEYFSEFVNFNSVLHNKNSVESIYQFFKERYDKMPRIGELNNMGIREDKKEEFEATYRNSEESLNQSEHYSEIMKDMALQLGSYQSVSTYLVQNSPFVYQTYNDLLFGKPDHNGERIPTGTCLPFSKKIFMTVNGKLLPCERIGHQFAIGSVNENGVELDFQSIADLYNRYYAKLDNRCHVCHNSKSCIQCIFNLPDLETTCQCHGFMTKNDYRAYENAQITYIYNNPEEYRNIMERVVII